MSSVELKIDKEVAFYSPNAGPHEGKMSEDSDAVYEWIIKRYKEPVEGDDPVALLLQNNHQDQFFLNAKTSS